MFMRIKFNALSNLLESDFGIEPSILKQEMNEFVVKNGCKKSDEMLNDFYWLKLNNILELCSIIYNDEEEILEKQRKVYCIMSNFLRLENRNSTHIQKNINSIDLKRRIQQWFVTEGEIIIGDNCNYCKQFENIKYPYEEITNNFPLDYDKCDNVKGCNCLVGFVSKRDENGRLIRK